VEDPLPTYQYACKECGHAFEQFQSFTDDALTVCPRCEGRLRKVFNAVGVVFKGSGFYRTDSRTDSRTDGKPAAASASGATSDSKSDSKSDSGSSTEKKSGTKAASTPTTSGSTSAA
jgi:putative FmdB family regulatory protein